MVKSALSEHVERIYDRDMSKCFFSDPAPDCFDELEHYHCTFVGNPKFRNVRMYVLVEHGGKTMSIHDVQWDGDPLVISENRSVMMCKNPKLTPVVSYPWDRDYGALAKDAQEQEGKSIFFIHSNMELDEGETTQVLVSEIMKRYMSR